MTRTAVGHFHDRAAADAAYDDLARSGFGRDDLSIMGRGREGEAGIQHFTAAAARGGVNNTVDQVKAPGAGKRLEKICRRHPLRTGLSLAGIAVAATMLLDMVMLSGGIDRSFSEMLLARGESVEPPVGEYRSGPTFTRYYWPLELDAELKPPGRDIVTPPGPPAPQ